MEGGGHIRRFLGVFKRGDESWWGGTLSEAKQGEQSPPALEIKKKCLENRRFNNSANMELNDLYNFSSIKQIISFINNLLCLTIFKINKIRKSN